MTTDWVAELEVPALFIPDYVSNHEGTVRIHSVVLVDEISRFYRGYQYTMSIENQIVNVFIEEFHHNLRHITVVDANMKASIRSLSQMD